MKTIIVKITFRDESEEDHKATKEQIEAWVHSGLEVEVEHVG